MKPNYNSVLVTALEQIKQEKFDEAVKVEVQRLKTYKPWYHKLFPFEIIIRKRK
ncbi:MAG: hypothetical protein JWP44_5040 [Mucilaginibacter sp.]|nr:hypothetical protein [Mucilaginibacter sp.]